MKEIKMIQISKINPDKSKKNWLQAGDKSFFKSPDPVIPEKDSPLASDIILEQRKRLTETYK